MPFRENRQECRERQGKAAGEVGLSSQDTKEESVWVGLVSDIGSVVSRSNQDFTVIAQRHGDKQTQNIHSLSENTVREFEYENKEHLGVEESALS